MMAVTKMPKVMEIPTRNPNLVAKHSSDCVVHILIHFLLSLRCNCITGINRVLTATEKIGGEKGVKDRKNLSFFSQ